MLLFVLVADRPSRARLGASLVYAQHPVVVPVDKRDGDLEPGMRSSSGSRAQANGLEEVPQGVLQRRERDNREEQQREQCQGG